MADITLIVKALNEYNADAGCMSVEYKSDEPMSLHTTFKIGGPAALYAVPDSAESFVFTVKTAVESGLRYFILGRGSDVLFDDGGYDGVVISTSGMNSVSFDGKSITAMAGVSMTEVSRCARDNAIAGMEFLCGIPGSIGGGVFMNAGAYGGEICQVLTESTYLDVANGITHTIPLAEHEYGYRTSVYRKNPDHIILSARFSGKTGCKEEISAKMNELLERRRSKQPLEYPSAGSVFKRCSGHYTGQMIEESGLKGISVGGAEVSEKHAGFIINKGGATCADVLKLIELVKKKIYENYGLDLETEVIYVK